MDTVEVTWAKGFIRFSDVETAKLPVLDGAGLYAVLGAKHDSGKGGWLDYRLLYIGQSFDQSLRARIPQPHDAYGCVDSWVQKNEGFEAVVMAGAITASNVQSVTSSLMDDVECCLINTNQPLCNDKCKDVYAGSELQVTNAGDYAPLKSVSTCKENP